MKIDVYFRRKYDARYHELLSQHLQVFDKTSTSRELRTYEWGVTTVDSEAELVEVLFWLHSDEDYSIARTTQYETAILPHIPINDSDTLVLNLDTHEIRVPRSVDKENVTVYNHDNIGSSYQSHGYVAIIPEIWKRDRCIPVSTEELRDMECRNYYYPGSPLGQHPEYQSVAMADLCD